MSAYRRSQKPETAVEERSPIRLANAERFLLVAIFGALVALGLVQGRIATHPIVPNIENEIVMHPAETEDPVERTARGEYDTDTGEFMPYPDAEHITPREQFEQDCRGVCERPYTGYRSRTDPEPEPGRVLYTEPEHMICACLRTGDSFVFGQVERWVAWRRMR